jgi:MFS transporter, UMF1 family
VPAEPPAAPTADADLQRRAVSGFTLYDVANSAFVTTVVTALGGPFLTALADAAADDAGRIGLLWLNPRAGALFAYAVSLSVLLQVLALPLLGALADRPVTKRRVLLAATWAGAGATLVVASAPGPLVGLTAFVLANVAYGSAILVYNAYLADVAQPGDRHRVSARGFAFGYAGGGFVLAVSLVLLTAAGPLGLDRATAVRLAIAASGVWWLGIGLVAVRRLDAARALPWAQPVVDVPPLLTQVRGTLRQLLGSLRALRALPGTARFLISFLLFNDAIQAVIALSAVVLTQELFVAQGRDAEQATPFLLQLVLLIQVVAIAGAWASARLAHRFGARQTLLGMLLVWVAIVLYAVLALDSTLQAYVMGAFIALVLGGSQSIARSLFSRMVPAGRQASFFSFYELAERGTAWIGTLIFAIVLDVTGSYRGALLSLLVLFVAGGGLLAVTDTDAAVAAAEQADTEALAAGAPAQPAA